MLSQQAMGFRFIRLRLLYPAQVHCFSRSLCDLHICGAHTNSGLSSNPEHIFYSAPVPFLFTPTGFAHVWTEQMRPRQTLWKIIELLAIIVITDVVKNYGEAALGQIVISDQETYVCSGWKWRLYEPSEPVAHRQQI